MSDKKETILTDRLPEKNIVNNDKKVLVGSEESNLAPVVENWISVVNNYRPKPTSASRDASHILADGEAMKYSHYQFLQTKESLWQRGESNPLRKTNIN